MDTDLVLTADFEISVLDVRPPGAPLGIVPDDLVHAGVDRHIVTVSPADDRAAERATQHH